MCRLRAINNSLDIFCSSRRNATMSSDRYVTLSGATVASVIRFCEIARSSSTWRVKLFSWNCLIAESFQEFVIIGIVMDFDFHGFNNIADNLKLSVKVSSGRTSSPRVPSLDESAASGHPEGQQAAILSG